MTTDEGPPGGQWRFWGDADPEILVAGSSHAYCLLWALEEGLAAPGRRCSVAYGEWVGDSRPLPTGERFWASVVEASAGRTVAILWDGNQHNHAFLLRPEPPFRVYDPEGEPVGVEEGRWLPQELFREAWAASYAPLRELLPRLTAVADVLLVCTPPPKPTPVIRSVLAGDPFFRQQTEALGVSVADLQITPAPVRVALWRILRDMLSDVADEAGVTFVPVPPGTTSQDGLLLPEFMGDDATHADSEYGGRVWQQLAALTPAKVAR